MESVSPNRVWTCLLWNNKNNFLIKQDLGPMEQEMRVYIKLRTQTSSTHHLHWCSKSHIGLMGNKRRVRQNGVIHSPKSKAPWTECWGSRADTGGVTRAGAGAALEMLIWRGCTLCSCGMTSIWMCQFEKDTTITVSRTGRWREEEVKSKRDWIWICWSRETSGSLHRTEIFDLNWFSSLNVRWHMKSRHNKPPDFFFDFFCPAFHGRHCFSSY